MNDGTASAAGNADDINEAVAACKAATPDWEMIPPHMRSRILNGIADKIEQNADELATIESEDNGKQYEDSMGDTMFSAQVMRYYAGLAMNIQGKSMMRDNFGMYNNSYAYTRKEPIGICGLITPWNYPLLMTAFKIAPTLASGCTGVCKIPDLTPLSSLKLIELIH